METKETTVTDNHLMPAEYLNFYREEMKRLDPKPFTCCLCGQTVKGFGNNPAPLMSAKYDCCDICNWTYVIPARCHASADTATPDTKKNRTYFRKLFAALVNSSEIQREREYYKTQLADPETESAKA